MPVKHATIEIPLHEAREMNEILSIQEGMHPDYANGETINIFNARFDDGMLVDLQIINADTPFIDPVLFAPCNTKKGWTEYTDVVVGEITDQLIGKHQFKFEDTEYCVHVKIDDRVACPVCNSKNLFVHVPADHIYSINSRNTLILHDFLDPDCGEWFVACKECDYRDDPPNDFNIDWPNMKIFKV